MSDEAEFYKRFAREFPTYGAWCSYIYDKIPPHELKLFEPRRIVPPGGYYSPKIVAASLYSILGENLLKMSLDEVSVPIEITAQTIAYHVLDEMVPIYYVANDFCRAVSATDLPDGFTLNDIKWPVPAMVLGLPPDFVREYTGFDLCYVYCARTDAGVYSCRSIPGAPEAVLPKDRVAWFWFTMPAQGRPEMFVSSYFREDPLTETLQKYAYTDYTDAPADTVQKNKEATDRISALILKLLCVLNWRDSLIESSRCIRPASVKKKVVRDALWSANFIGKSYRLQREAPAGSHASPRLHRRRGHATYQIIGKKEDFIPVSALPRTPEGKINWSAVDTPTRDKFLKSHKYIWIEPVWIGL
jgi:hypothetical protein